MAIVFYKEVGFTDTQIAYYSKLMTAGVTILFSMAGGLLNARIGSSAGLFVGGIAMAASNLMFSVDRDGRPRTRSSTPPPSSWTGSRPPCPPSPSWRSSRTSHQPHAYTAPQYAMLAPSGPSGERARLRASGLVVDALHGNWALFFVITAL